MLPKIITLLVLQLLLFKSSQKKNNRKRGATGALIASQDSPDMLLRYKAAQALGSLGDPQTIESLEKILKNDPSGYVKSSAAESIKQLARIE